MVEWSMIRQWIKTGQPVYIRIGENALHKHSIKNCKVVSLADGKSMIATTEPDWNIPGADYSFTPFG